MKGEYYHTKESVDEYTQLAADVSGKQLITKLQDFLADGSSILEIGSGPGTDWNILNDSFNVTGSDNSSEFLTHLKDKNTNGEFLLLDAVTLQTNNTFDGIYSNKVMHHLTDKEFTQSIKRQYEITNPDGIICHSYCKGEGSEVFKGLFVNYHSETTLQKAFEQYFDIISLEDYAEFEENDLDELDSF